MSDSEWLKQQQQNPYKAKTELEGQVEAKGKSKCKTHRALESTRKQKKPINTYVNKTSHWSSFN